MVNTNSSKLTEEEELFQKKLAKLKKKKKAIAASKVPKLEKQESVTEAPQLSTEICPADEQTKKLKKLAAIKEALASKEKTFKRTKRKKESEGKTPVAFHPFSQGESEVQEQHVRSGSSEHYPKYSGSDKALSSPEYHPKFSYNDHPLSTPKNYDHEERYQERNSTPKNGRTIYVHGHGITDTLVRSAFVKFGTVTNISLELERNCAFVTFNNYEAANDAIKKMNNSTVDGVSLKVSFARKQPNIDVPGGDSSNNNSNWSFIAASGSQKGNHKDTRSLVKYDDQLFGSE